MNQGVLWYEKYESKMFFLNEVLYFFYSTLMLFFAVKKGINQK